MSKHGKRKACIFESCMKYPTFNFEGTKPPVYCKQHAEDGMLYVRSKRCLDDFCTKSPHFDFEGIKRRCTASNMLRTAC